MKFRYIYLGVLFSVISLVTLSTPLAAQIIPRELLLWDRDSLYRARNAYRANNPLVVSAVTRLVQEAEQASSIPYRTITEKSFAPVGGTYNDYLSIEHNYWPDPVTFYPFRNLGRVWPDRLIDVPDLLTLNRFVGEIRSLALAWFFTGIRDYAQQATRRMKHFLITANSKMNPHFRYAQSIPGLRDGESYGVIEGERIPYLVDAATILAGSPFWVASVDREIRKWFETLYIWLRNSPNGRAEANMPNNHSSHYFLQLVTSAAAIRRNDLAIRHLEEAKLAVLERQIESDGTQPAELARPISWTYSNYNLDFLVLLANCGRTLGVNLWEYTNSKGGNLRTALDFLIPYAQELEPWPYREDRIFRSYRMFMSLKAAAIAFDEPTYNEISEEVLPTSTDYRLLTFYPLR